MEAILVQLTDATFLLQIISFLQQNAHPRVAERLPSVPENVTDQVILSISSNKYSTQKVWLLSLVEVMNLYSLAFHRKQNRLCSSINQWCSPYDVCKGFTFCLIFLMFFHPFFFLWQIRLWEADLNRVEITPSHFYDEFPSRVNIKLPFLSFFCHDSSCSVLLRVCLFSC